MKERKLNGKQKDKYRMRIQEHFYDFYQKLVLRFRMRYIYCDRIDGDDLFKDMILAHHKALFLDECDKLGQERSI